MAAKLTADSWIFTWSYVPFITFVFIGLSLNREYGCLFLVGLGVLVSVSLQILRVFKFVQIRLGELAVLVLVAGNLAASMLAKSELLAHSFQSKRDIAVMIALVGGFWMPPPEACCWRRG